MGSIQTRTFTQRDLAFLALPLALIVGPFLLWPVAFGLLASFTDYSPFVTRLRFTGKRVTIRVERPRQAA